MQTNLLQKFKNQTRKKTLTDEEIIEYYTNQEEQRKIPKQQLQIITIKGQEIPVVIKTTNQKTTGAIGTQGILSIHKAPTDERSLKTIIRENTDTLLEEYQKTNKKIVNRTEQQFHQIVQKHLNHYQEKLGLQNVKIKYQYMVLNKLGNATKHNSITLNNYLQYMQEETIKYVIYHELCHIYVYKKYKKFNHQEEFQEIMKQEYTPEQETAIIKH